MDVLSVNTSGSKPRKGSVILTETNRYDSDLTIQLPSPDLIASFRLKPLGYVLLGILQSDDQGVLVELQTDEQELQPGYHDRNTKVSILVTGEEEPQHTYLSRLNTKDLIVAYKSDTQILSVYYFGNTTELQMADYVPSQISISVGFPLQLERYSFCTHYDPDAPAIAELPEILRIWRKWYKDQLELTNGYRNFADALAAYQEGNELLAGVELWDEVGLHVDEPVPEDFL